MVFNETTNDDFILPNTTYQRHFETRATTSGNSIRNKP